MGDGSLVISALSAERLRGLLGEQDRALLEAGEVAQLKPTATSRSSISSSLVDEVGEDLVVDHHVVVESPGPSLAVTIDTVDRGGTGAGGPVVDQLLVFQVELAQLSPALVVVEADVGDDEASVVGVVGLVLLDDAHDSANELDVGREGAVRPEDGGDAETRVVEPLAEHLDLHDAVEGPDLELLEDRVNLVHAAVDLGGDAPALLVQGADLASVVDRAGGGDHLVLEAGLGAHGVALLDAGLDDVAVALLAQGDASAEPGLLAQLEHLVEGVLAGSSASVK